MAHTGTDLLIRDGEAVLQGLLAQMYLLAPFLVEVVGVAIGHFDHDKKTLKRVEVGNSQPSQSPSS